MAGTLADAYTATPSRAIGVNTCDPGLTSMLKDLDGDFCQADVTAYCVWAVQLLATMYTVVCCLIVWSHDSLLRASTVMWQSQQLLMVLTVARGTWALAPLGVLIPFGSSDAEKGNPLRLLALRVTTGIAVVLDWLFAARAFVIAAMIAHNSAVAWVTAISFLLPALEAYTLLCGKLLFQIRVTL
jgi:hypothetical protein